MVRALTHEVRATQLAMREIRQVNPAAELVQTEDLARVWSTPALRYQADYENERRWLSLDMLCGRVGSGHPLWQHLWWLGLTHADLDPMIENACPPDIVGGNYYITSERFLDHRLDRYPAWTHGGNGRNAYADIEAVRVLDDDLAGPSSVLREAWERYERPVAVTEAHLGSTPEEQVRWLAMLWQSVVSLRRNGVDARAVTVWALFGSVDWPSLCTREDELYEPGAFDVRTTPPRPTPVARFAKSLADGSEATVGAARQRGWWERRERLLYPPVDRAGRDIRSQAA